MFLGFLEIWNAVVESLRIRTRARFPKQLFNSSQYTYAPERVKPPEFKGSEQVRVLLFRERNGVERRLLFDSKAVRKREKNTPLGKNEKVVDAKMKESSIEKSFKLNAAHDELIYESRKPTSDEQLMREMIFGSVSISYQGATTKVHTIRSPPKIMLSVVFPAPPVMFRVGEQDLEESGQWNNSTGEICIPKKVESSENVLAHSVPVDVPSRSSGNQEAAINEDPDFFQSHDGYNSLPSCYLSPETTAKPCLPRTGSYNSLHRRLLQNKATSMELGLQMTPKDDLNEYPRSSGQKRVKLGLSVVISLDENQKCDESRQFKDFLFTHIILIERYVMILKETVIKAYLNRRCFINLMFEGSMKLQNSIQDLYTAPRLQSPEWLSIISSPNHCSLSLVYMQKFVKLLKKYDKKETNFFVSTLLTAVLTHHLAWVPTVIPTDSKISTAQDNHKHMPHWVDILAKARPYNPLWVQLGDLYGALACHLKIAKTVVTGQKTDIISQFIQILSYFIRCSDICEQQFTKVDQESFVQSNCSRNGASATCANKEPSNSKPVTRIRSSCSSKHCSSPVNRVACASNHILNTSSSPKDTCLCTNSRGASVSCSVNCTSCSRSPLYSASNRTSVTMFNEQENVGKNVDNQLLDHDSNHLRFPDSSRIQIDNGVDSLGYESMEELPDAPEVRISSSVSPAKSVNTVSSSCDNRSLINTCDQNKNHEQWETSDQKICTSVTNAKFTCGGDEIPQTKHASRGVKKEYLGQATEEGYHSMEEPQSPNKEGMRLTEMIKMYDSWIPEGLMQLPLPASQTSDVVSEVPKICQSFGWSLMAGVSDHYLTDFCLQGVNTPISDEEIRKDLLSSVQVPVLGEQTVESVCIIANTDNWSVQLMSSNWSDGDKHGSCGVRIGMSSLVGNICECILNMSELGISLESCVTYLEDRLQELYFRSLTLSEYLRQSKRPTSVAKLASALSLSASDMPLLLSIATTHSPYLSAYN